MRVIAGLYRHRLLAAPRGMATRPTSDRLRETLFNILAPRIEGARLADLYAGTGAVGIEALSRGASEIAFVERSPEAVAALRSNLAALGIGGGFSVEQRSVLSALAARARAARPFDLVFLDPPWEDAAAYLQTLTALSARPGALLAPGAIVVAEHARRSAPPPAVRGRLERYRVLEQGDAALSFYREVDRGVEREMARDVDRGAEREAGRTAGDGTA
jgi:16S rRNA (guanine(966)-N(2))-methyltransferase RsmD